MKKIILLTAFLIIITSCNSKKEKKLATSNFEVGIISDCQYCNCDIKWDRYYKKSPNRLRNAITQLNKEKLSYTIHLGDFIDKDFSSYDSVVPIWNKLKFEKHHVLGNHDFKVADSLKPLIFDKLNLKKRYYSFTKNNWRFIVLDGNDLSKYGALDSLKIKQTDSLFRSLEKDSLPYVKKWNGGLSNTQLHWVKTELDLATKNNEKVGFYCHFPIYPVDLHNIWNREQFIALIKDYNCVKLFFNGHNHAGAYVEKNGVHYLTFKGMVDTKDSTSFATASFKKDTIHIKGHGREPSRTLIIQ